MSQPTPEELREQVKAELRARKERNVEDHELWDPLLQELRPDTGQ